MNKYIDVKELRTKVNELRQDWLGDSTGLKVGEAAAELGAAESILDSFDDIIDSLQQEQPEVNRYDKIAKSEWFQKAYKNKPLGSELEDSEFFFNAVYQAAKAEMMEKAITGTIFQLAEYYPKELVALYNGELKHGDKVKILILDENE